MGTGVVTAAHGDTEELLAEAVGLEGVEMAVTRKELTTD
jgi:hypothetical protein